MNIVTKSALNWRTKDTGSKLQNPSLLINSLIISYDQLPTTSVIVTFYNEGYTTLLRTVYSILHESPRALLKEIILIDDMSDKDEFPKLGHDLEVELSKLDRVRLIRTKKREGLVRARLLGAEVAKGNLHIE